MGTTELERTRLKFALELSQNQTYFPVGWNWVSNTGSGCGDGDYLSISLPFPGSNYFFGNGDEAGNSQPDMMFVDVDVQKSKSNQIITYA